MRNSTIFALIGGMVVGAAAVILLAPESGREAKRRVRGFIDEQGRRIMDGVCGCGCGEQECDCDGDCECQKDGK